MREQRRGAARPGGTNQVMSHPERSRIRSVPLVLAWPAQAARRGLFKRHLRVKQQVGLAQPRSDLTKLVGSH